MTLKAEDWVALGVVAQPHGVSGRMKLKLYTDDISPYISKLSRKDGSPLDARMTGTQKDMVIIAVDAVRDRNEADSWRGTELGVPRSALPPIDTDDVFYIHDLIGLEARSTDGTVIGTIENVVNYGASDILVITGSNGDETMLAFSEVTVPTIDAEGGFVLCELPEILPPNTNEDGAA